MQEMALGQLVHSKSGRDKDRYFVIVNILNDDYVLIADGSFRKISNPKKKKIKHLVLHEKYSEEVRMKLNNNEQITDSDLKTYLQSMGLFQ